MSNEINGTRRKFNMKLRKCNNKIILFAAILHRFQSTSSKHSKPEVVVCNISTVPTCLKTKGKAKIYLFLNNTLDNYNFHIK